MFNAAFLQCAQDVHGDLALAADSCCWDDGGRKQKRHEGILLFASDSEIGQRVMAAESQLVPQLQLEVFVAFDGARHLQCNTIAIIPTASPLGCLFVASITSNSDIPGAR